jgi:hypothetical protein
MPEVRSIPKCACGHSDAAHSLTLMSAFCTCPWFQLHHVAEEIIGPGGLLRVSTTNRQPLRS